MNNLDEDSLVFSVTYENYIKNIKQDKQNKTLGEWSIKDDKINTLKYAYVYLVGSNQMVVKKYYIEKFEKSDSSKGYMDPDKKCFIFSKSEDLFVDFPLVVQGRQYVNSSTLDNAQKISPDQVNVRMMNAKESKSEGTKSKVKTFLPFNPSGTSSFLILCARPSTIAVLPTPGSPISTGLFLVLL